MIYNFDEVIDRTGTESGKWDEVGVRVGNDQAIPMWVADMDFRCPQPVTDAIIRRAQHPIYGYTYITDEFRAATQGWVARQHGWNIQKDWVVFTAGIVTVLYTAVQRFTEKGDEVIIQGPVYRPFIKAVEDNGRVVSDNSLIYRDGAYEIDFDDLERRAASPKAKLMILCSPHNPTGRVWTREELERIGQICLKHNVLILSDEIHADLTLFGNHHTPIASLSPALEQRTITCYAPTKTFNMAALWASGIVVPNAEIRAELKAGFDGNRSVQQNVFAAPAYIAAYTQCDDYKEQLVAYLEDNVRYLDSYLKEKMPKIKLVAPQATYLMWLDATALGLTPEETDDFFIQDSRVGVNRGNVFGPEGLGFERLNIGCPRSTMKKALDQLFEQYQKRGF